VKNFSLIFFITIIFFLIANVLVVLTWPIYSEYNAKKHSYIKEQKDLLNLSEQDLVILHNETWRNYDKFRFIPFLGHSETDRIGKLVNFTESDGRKVNRPQSCDKNIYMYGGSTTFGYNVTDNQTIANYLQEFVGKDLCVFNHGRAYFYSKQENNLFINHVENRKKIDFAIFLDGYNERCGGYEYAKHLNNSFSLLTERPYLMWKKSSRNFLHTLPIVQFANSLVGSGRWINDGNNNILKIDSCDEKVGLDDLFETRLSLRNSFCEINGINCHSFLQPMAGASGIQSEKLLSKDKKIVWKKKYQLLLNSKGHIDLKYVLNDDTILSYVDGAHYSPASNKKIALELYKFIK